MRLLSFVGAISCVVLVGACTAGQVREVESLPAEAVAVGSEALVTDELAGVADLRQGDELFLLPGSQGQSVLVRLRTGEPPLLFGTSCDVVSSVSLPAAWKGVCLEYTLADRRVHGRFPYGTFSLKAFPGVAPADSPEAALVAAHLGDPEFAQALVRRMILIYADDEMVDLRGRVEDGELCRLYAVFGFMEEGRFQYLASPAGACNF